jgi:Spy/CpxP family protein refolding chaperone
MIMKRAHYIIALLLLFSCTIVAQQADPATAPPPSTIIGLKMAFVTKQLALTNEEAQKFWPVYYSYSGELRKAKQGRRGDVIEMEENMLNVRKKYRTEFKKILNTDERVNKALTVDRDFINVVRKEMEKRQGAKMRGPKQMKPGEQE